MASWLLLGLYSLMSKLSYKQTQDLTRVFVIFHNKNFSSFIDSTRFQLFCPAALLRKYSAIPFQTAALSTPANPGS